MAWLDDRAWAHPKVADLSDAAFRTWVSGICYASGFATRGRLTPSHQRLVGATKAVRRDLVAAGLWRERDEGVIEINDWDEHNGARDAKREADRERQRRWRESQRDLSHKNERDRA